MIIITNKTRDACALNTFSQLFFAHLSIFNQSRDISCVISGRFIIYDLKTIIHIYTSNNYIIFWWDSFLCVECLQKVCSCRQPAKSDTCVLCLHHFESKIVALSNSIPCYLPHSSTVFVPPPPLLNCLVSAIFWNQYECVVIEKHLFVFYCTRSHASIMSHWITCSSRCWLRQPHTAQRCCSTAW